MEPLNYNVNIPNPVEAFQAGMINQLNINDKKTAMANQAEDRQKAQIQSVWAAKSADEQASDLRMGGQMLSALNSKDNGAALSIIDTRLQALKNSGNEKHAADLQSLRDIVEKHPESAAQTMQYMLATVPGGDKMLESLGKIGKEGRDAAMAPGELKQKTAEATLKEIEAKFSPQKLQADLWLTQAQTGLANAQAGKAKSESEQKLAGLMTPEQKLDIEDKLRKEYGAQTKPYQEVKSSYNRLLTSEDNAVGDISLIFGYMKMLDPGSVVREGEFATAQNSAGVPAAVQNMYNKAINGERLTAGQRSGFKGQAGKLYSASRKQEEELRAGMKKIAIRSGANPDNIFYTENDSSPENAGGAPDSTVKSGQNIVNWSDLK
jgi:hypothetical protein